MSTRTRAWEEAVRSLDLEPTPRVRPNLFLWLWYALWGPLPDRHRVWVLFDATCATWVLRHFARILTLAVLPITAVILFLPGPLGVRVFTSIVAGGGAFVFTAVWVNEATDFRLLRAGWPWGTGDEVRQRRSELTEWMLRVRKL